MTVAEFINWTSTGTGAPLSKFARTAAAFCAAVGTLPPAVTTVDAAD
jgi:hypothetical protein